MGGCAGGPGGPEGRRSGPRTLQSLRAEGGTPWRAGRSRQDAARAPAPRPLSPARASSGPSPGSGFPRPKGLRQSRAGLAVNPPAPPGRGHRSPGRSCTGRPGERANVGLARGAAAGRSASARLRSGVAPAGPARRGTTAAEDLSPEESLASADSVRPTPGCPGGRRGPPNSVLLKRVGRWVLSKQVTCSLWVSGSCLKTRGQLWDLRFCPPLMFFCMRRRSLTPKVFSEVPSSPVFVLLLPARPALPRRRRRRVPQSSPRLPAETSGPLRS